MSAPVCRPSQQNYNITKTYYIKQSQQKENKKQNDISLDLQPSKTSKKNKKAGNEIGALVATPNEAI